MPNSSRHYGDANVYVNASQPFRHRILVLGASGFLGRHVRRHLIDLGIDHVTAGRTKGSHLDLAVDLAEARQHEIDQLLTDVAPTAVINCSGAVRGTTAELTRGNVVAVHALVSSLASNAPGTRIVQLGSSAEYGGVPTGEPMNENTPTQPSSPYGFTKLAASELVLHARSQGTDAVVLRIFNVSGPGSPTSTMLGGLVDQLRTAGPDPVLTLQSLDGWRDYIDVRDVAAAACLAATTSNRLPPVLNIGTGIAVQTREWVQLLIDASKTNAQIVEHADQHSNHKATAASVAWQCADITAAQTYLGWTPTIDLTASIRDTWSCDPPTEPRRSSAN